MFQEKFRSRERAYDAWGPVILVCPDVTRSWLVASASIGLEPTMKK
ncbi:MAG: hypothetical protein ACP5QR_17625 [Rhizomicrobium sp.]